MDSNEDSVLVELSRSGERSAFDELFTKYRHRLLAHMIRMLPSRADAEDVVQEAFLNAFQAIPNFRGESCFFSWIYKITLNCAFSSMRRDKKRIPACSLSLRHEDECDLDEGGPAGSASAAEMFQAKQLIKSIDLQLNSMPIIFAQALIFREVDGFTYDQISQSMHCSVGTVRSRLFRARQLINAALGDR
jgi:RNA polymerase sigma-70 factor (ECF subfamily)